MGKHTLSFLHNIFIAEKYVYPISFLDINNDTALVKCLNLACTQIHGVMLLLNFSLCTCLIFILEIQFYFCIIMLEIHY